LVEPTNVARSRYRGMHYVPLSDMQSIEWWLHSSVFPPSYWSRWRTEIKNPVKNNEKTIVGVLSRNMWAETGLMSWARVNLKIDVIGKYSKTTSK